jgi:hypothetical protein
MTNRGIDYGFGRTNIDTETGIRFGVIPIHDVTQAWCDSSEAHYADVCPACGAELDEQTEVCECGQEINDDCYDAEPDVFFVDADGLRAYQSADSTDIFIEESPYFTYAQFCSPCAPGACHLRNPLDEPHPDNRAFCFGHDWFEDGQAPYQVYSVKTGKPVPPVDQHQVDGNVRCFNCGETVYSDLAALDRTGWALCYACEAKAEEETP